MLQSILTATVPDWAAIPILIAGGGGAGLMLLSSWLLLVAMGASPATHRRWAGPLETGALIGGLFVLVAILAAVIVAVLGP